MSFGTAQALDLPGVEEAIKAAASRSYEAVLVVVVMLVFMGGLTWLVRTMAKRIDQLESWQTQILTDLVKENTVAFTRLTTMLSARPCLVPDAEKLAELEARHAGGKM